MDSYALIGLSSNVGQRLQMLDYALAILDEAFTVSIIAESSIYETEPVGPASAQFLNLAIVVKTSNTPQELLDLLKKIERMLGRRHRVGSVDREIDLDLLMMDDQLCESGSLTLPHPRMLERPFVLVPLAEVVPRWRHPQTRETYADLAARAMNLPGGIKHKLFALHDGRCLEVRSLRNETPRFTPADLALDATIVGQTFLCHGKITIANAVAPDLIRALGNLLLDQFRSPSGIPTSHYRTGDTPDGYTPPAVENVRGYDPDPMRHFWDVASAGGKLPLASRPLAIILRQLLAETGTDALKAIDLATGTKMAEDAAGADHHLRIAHYLNESCGGEVIFPSHLDWNYLTLHLGGSGDGMEVLDGETWVGTDIAAGDILVFPGSLLRTYGEALPRALRHRVRALIKDRISMILWIATRGEVVLPNGEIAHDRELRLARQVRADAK